MSWNAGGLTCIRPDWPAPANVHALVTTRQGGVSDTPYDSFNLGLHVGDRPEAVLKNRQLLQRLISTQYEPQWLQQVHGTTAIEAKADGPVQEADACYSSDISLPCSVMTADCLPVLFCSRDGAQVAAAHAGWRGLADGVLESTVNRFDAPARELLAWFGPAIGPEKFEVGPEVRDAFLAFSMQCKKAFISREEKPDHWLADIYMLARIRLNALGVEHIYGGGLCTYSDERRFFSYRRDRTTGRMASLIWRSS